MSAPDFKIVREYPSFSDNLEEKIRDLLDQGYELHGPLHFEHGEIWQALVYKPKPTRSRAKPKTE
jgi:hypothetical protein